LSWATKSCESSSRHVADQAADLVLLEDDAPEVLGLVLQVEEGHVDAGPADLRVLRGHRVDRRLLQEADADDQVVLLPHERGEVGDVVGLAVRQKDLPLDFELLLGLQQAGVGEVVEPTVVQAADVGDEPDLELLCLLRRTAAGRERAGERGDECCDHGQRQPWRPSLNPHRASLWSRWPRC
jgi:hypothetical protein